MVCLGRSWRPSGFRALGLGCWNSLVKPFSQSGSVRVPIRRMQDLLVRAEPADQKEASNALIEYIFGLYRDNGKENGNYRDYRDYIGVIEGLYKACLGAPARMVPQGIFVQKSSQKWRARNPSVKGSSKVPPLTYPLSRSLLSTARLALCRNLLVPSMAVAP